MNASVGLCHCAALWEPAAWGWRYNSAFCSHHLPLGSAHRVTSQHSPDPAPPRSYLQAQAHLRNRVASQRWVRWRIRERRPPDQNTLRSGYVTAPPLWTDCWGRSFSRPFVTSLPGGRRSRSHQFWGTRPGSAEPLQELDPEHHRHQSRPTVT